MQHQRFPDANVVRSAYAWLLAPLARGANGQLQAGYSAAVADADEDRFVLATAAATLSSDRSALRLRRSLPSLLHARAYRRLIRSSRRSAREAERPVLRAGGSYGFRAREDVTTFMESRGQVVGSVARRSYTPWTLRGSLEIPTSPSFVVKARRRVGPDGLLPLDDRQLPACLPIRPGRSRRRAKAVRAFTAADDRWMERWRHRSAPEVRFVDRLILFSLTAAGLVAVVRLADWWFRRTHVADPVLFVGLSLAFWYGISRIVIGWINYLAIDRPVHRPAPPGLHVAIFTTSSPGEPVEMFERTLAACARVRYAHTTYLLDDTQDRRFREAAERHGAVWLDLVDCRARRREKSTGHWSSPARNSFSSWIRITSPSPSSSTGCSDTFRMPAWASSRWRRPITTRTVLSARRPRPNRPMPSTVPRSWASTVMAPASRSVPTAPSAGRRSLPLADMALGWPRIW